MRDRLERLQQRTNGFTTTPRQCAIAAYVALGALTLIVLTGAAVRLTGSGLGCPKWPKCYGGYYPPLSTHAVIEYSNRLITGPICIAAGAAWLAALRRRPYRRDLTWIAALLPLGVLAQAVLGGLTVQGRLDYGWVMGHFALSMLILLAASALAWRAGGSALGREGRAEAPRDERDAGGVGDAGAEEAGVGGFVGDPAARAYAGARAHTAARAADRAVILSARALAVLGAVTIVAGTAATAAGPHAGGSPGQQINRLDIEGRGTMDFVIHRHAEIALAFGLLAVWVWWLARRRGADARVRRAATVLCVLIALQGVVGLDQYKTHLPTELVWIHVALACAAWLAALWTAYAAGRLHERATDVRHAAGGRETENTRDAVLAGR
ncbi:MAG TPA: COX15/CtaA family protein [Solirubrobacteraceae bacterium]